VPQDPSGFSAFPPGPTASPARPTDTSPDRWNDVCFLLENRRPEHGGRSEGDAPGAFLFERPVGRTTARTAEALLPALDALEHERASGRYVCGYVAYEAAAALMRGAPPRTSPQDEAIPPGGEMPLLDFFSFEERECLSAVEADEWLSRRSSFAGTPAIHDISRTETRETYRAKIRRIEEYIAAGDTYQVNFTLKYRFAFEGNALTLYRALRERQRVAFGAYIRLPEAEILSFSPELFVRRDGDWLTAQPMKGTAPRGTSSEEDRRIITDMQADPKTRSENLMIVDLIRSDVGRIAELGSVVAEDLFEVQTFETVHQMISTVRAKIRIDTSLRDVFECMFPCGSVTGAPKVRTMEIIRELEGEPRGIYTGAIGFAAPRQAFCFSVPIRTLVARGQQGEMGVGSGIVHESEADREFDECLLKASFLFGINTSFRLVESMRFDADRGILVRQAEHMERMRASAAYFGFVFDGIRVRGEIGRVTATCRAGQHKIRVTGAQNGEVVVSSEPLVCAVSGDLPWVVLSERPIESGSCFRRHKTTERRLYDDEYRAGLALGAYDVLFLNERGEVAEASRHNVFVEKNGRLATPPVSAGALPGIARRFALADPAWNAVEEAVSCSDLRSAARIVLTNSVRGIVPVRLRPAR
jgi:para-aminobenzoate synthetase/4-amino-4-deoxychorismate lyase